MALQITQVKSANGAKHNQLATLETLGLRRIRHTVVVPDRPQFRGMVATINHLVAVSEVPDDTTLAETASRPLTAADAGEPGVVGDAEGASAKTEALMEEQGIEDSGDASSADFVQLPRQKIPEGMKVKPSGPADDDEDESADAQPAGDSSVDVADEEE